MVTPVRPVARGSRFSTRLAVVLVLLVTGVGWWAAGADVRRVDAACGAWLEHREGVRNALAETQEAEERAADDHADRIGSYFNDEEATRATTQEWVDLGPSVSAGLHHDRGASDIERGAAFAFRTAREGLAELQRETDEQDPVTVADWLPEASARLTMVDDSCLAAARGH